MPNYTNRYDNGQFFRERNPANPIWNLIWKKVNKYFREIYGLLYAVYTLKVCFEKAHNEDYQDFVLLVKKISPRP